MRLIFCFCSVFNLFGHGHARGGKRQPEDVDFCSATVSAAVTASRRGPLTGSETLWGEAPVIRSPQSAAQLDFTATAQMSNERD